MEKDKIVKLQNKNRLAKTKHKHVGCIGDWRKPFSNKPNIQGSYGIVYFFTFKISHYMKLYQKCRYYFS